MRRTKLKVTYEILMLIDKGVNIANTIANKGRVSFVNTKMLLGILEERGCIVDFYLEYSEGMVKRYQLTEKGRKTALEIKAVLKKYAWLDGV